MATVSTVGGHVVLDLVNTDRDRHLHTPADLLRSAGWLDLVDAGTAGAIEASWAADPARRDAALGATLELREAVHRILLAALDEPVEHDTAALPTLHRHWADATRRAVLTPSSSGAGTLRVTAGPDLAYRIPDALALAALDLLTTVDLHQLKMCPPAEGGCGWLFLDRSRNGSRRWCSMRDCGTQVKSQRLTARRRAARGGS